MNLKIFAPFVLPIAALLALTPWVSSGMGLLLGLMVTLIFGNPYIPKMKNLIHRLLAISVVGLGAGMNLEMVAKVGAHGILYTIFGISVAFVVGNLLGRSLKTGKDTSLLITVGTAICGGSAIAAVAPIIRAKHHEVSVALGIVFMLNALALFLFPWVGHALDLDQNQFGLWSALAIHDTSSVVGATLQYGAQAVEVGTTIKLARALWIIPVAILIGFIRARNQIKSESEPATKMKIPWFILGFIVASGLVTWIPQLAPAGYQIEMIAKRLMVLTLFLIGASLTLETIKGVGMKPFVQGILLWIVMASGSLVVIYYRMIS